MYWKFSRIFTVRRKNLFQDSNFSKSYLPPIRGYYWQKKKEIKMIRRGYYSSKNFQDSTKKSTKNKTLGYLPRVLSFNAFELGAKSENQVFSSEEASRSIVSSKTQLVTIGTLDTTELLSNKGGFDLLEFNSHSQPMNNMSPKLLSQLPEFLHSSFVLCLISQGSQKWLYFIL
jgi:hypothetical protein